MMKRSISILLAIVFMLGLVACNKEPEEIIITQLTAKDVKNQDLGDMMPKILFAHDGKIVIHGTFGLFVINGEDGSIYRGVNTPIIGHNFMTGDMITYYNYSPDYNSIYFYNKTSDDELVNDFFYFYQIEENTLRQIPNEENPEVMPEQPAFSIEFAGGEPEGYYSGNVVFYDENTTVYLRSKDWRVKDLEMVLYHRDTEEFTIFNLFN